MLYKYNKDLKEPKFGTYCHLLFFPDVPTPWHVTMTQMQLKMTEVVSMGVVGARTFRRVTTIPMLHMMMVRATSLLAQVVPILRLVILMLGQRLTMALVSSLRAQDARIWMPITTIQRLPLTTAIASSLAARIHWRAILTPLPTKTMVAASSQVASGA